MPRKGDSPYSAEWFKKAAEDFVRVKRRLEEDDLEDAAFHLQQAVEKYLKGFLLSQGWKLKKIHDLEALLDDAIRYRRALDRFRPLVQQITGYYSSSATRPLKKVLPRPTSDRPISGLSVSSASFADSA